MARGSWTAIIPVRGGSKGLPGKNVRDLYGKPVFLRAVEQAFEAGAGRVVVSSDIISVLQYPYRHDVTCVRRPSILAGDQVPMTPVLIHAIENANIGGTAVLLQATSPLRRVEDIETSLALFRLGKHQLVMSVTAAESAVLKWGTLSGATFTPLLHPQYCFENRQSLPPVVRPNGAVYVFDAAWLREGGTLASSSIGAAVMSAENSIDIDTETDFQLCEEILRARTGETTS